MSDATQEVSFDAQLAAATAEAEREEAAYLAARNGEQVEETPSETEELSEVDKLKARIAELEAGKKEDEPQELSDEEKAAKEKADEEAAKAVEGQFTDEDRATAAPWYEALAKGEAIPEAAFEFAKERFGITDRSMVEAYMNGALAQTQGKVSEHRTAVIAAVGGEDQYSAVTSWASDNLSEAEIAEYDAAVNGSDTKLAKAAATGLLYRFKAEGGKAPSLLGGRTAAAVVDTFANMDEMVRAVNDPRYDSDPAYRKSVEAKIDRSNGTVTVTKGSRSY
jgi:hypothetical protein